MSKPTKFVNPVTKHETATSSAVDRVALLRQGYQEQKPAPRAPAQTATTSK